MAHIPGAISIPIEELEEKLAYLPSNCDVVAYCRGPYCLMSVEAVELKTTARTLRSVARKAENLMSTKVSDSTSISNQPEWLQSYLVSPEKQHQLYRKTLFIVIISQFFWRSRSCCCTFYTRICWGSIIYRTSISKIRKTYWSCYWLLNRRIRRNRSRNFCFN